MDITFQRVLINNQQTYQSVKNTAQNLEDKSLEILHNIRTTTLPLNDLINQRKDIQKNRQEVDKEIREIKGILNSLENVRGNLELAVQNAILKEDQLRKN